MSIGREEALVHDKLCVERRRLTLEIDLCLLRHRESVRDIIAAASRGEGFDFAFNKSREQFDALRLAREFRENHISKHNC
jgi:hypothetical protein